MHGRFPCCVVEEVLEAQGWAMCLSLVCRSTVARGRGLRGASRGRGAGAGRGRSGASTGADAREVAQVRREDGSVQCTFSGNGDDFIEQHW